MAGRNTFTLDEVMNELDGMEDDSEDDFDGYLDLDTDEREKRGEKSANLDVRARNTRGESQNLDVGANIEIGASGTSSIDENDQFESIPEYTLQPGCSADVGGNSPLEYFSLLFSNDMLEHIVTQTNLSHDLGPHSRVRRWSKAVHDLSELQRFLAIIIIMGLVRYPQIESHWSTLWPYSNAQFSTVSVCIIQQHVNYCTITPTYMYTRKLYTYTHADKQTHTQIHAQTDISI